MGFSSLAVMANSLLLQFEGRKLQRLPRPQGQQQPSFKAASSSTGGSLDQQPAAASGPAGSSGNGSGYVAPA